MTHIYLNIRGAKCQHAHRVVVSVADVLDFLPELRASDAGRRLAQAIEAACNDAVRYRASGEVRYTPRAERIRS